MLGVVVSQTGALGVLVAVIETNARSWFIVDGSYAPPATAAFWCEFHTSFQPVGAAASVPMLAGVLYSLLWRAMKPRKSSGLIDERTTA